MGKKSKAPPPPDYAALATQQAALNKTAANEQTVANRPNQNTAFGSTSWEQGPDGQWTQNQTLNPQDQALLDQQRQFQGQQQGIASDLLGKAGGTLGQPLDTSGLPDLKGYDLSQMPELQGMDLSGMNKLDPGFGAVEEVQKAMMGRMAPARQQARDQEIQRLKNQGIPEDSDAFQRAVQRIDQGDTDAQQQALLGATSAYGDIFNRGLQGNDQTLRSQQMQAALRGSNRAQLFGEQGSAAQLAGQQRQQGLSEREQARQSPLNDFMKLTQGINPTAPQMPSFMSGTGYTAADMYGAGKDTYQGQLDQYNANQARKGGMMGGLGTLAGGAAGAFFGGPAGAMLGAKLGGAAGGMMGG